MLEEKIVWHSQTAPDGRELVTFGTPAWPIEFYGPWNFSGSDCKTVIPWHWHDELELNMAMEGETDMMADGKSWHLRPGQGVFFNSGVMHRAQTPESQHGGINNYFSLVFSPWIVGGAPGSVFWQRYVTPLIESQECRAVYLSGETEWEREILAAMRRIIEVWPEKRPGYELIVREELSRAVFLLGQNCLHCAPPPTEKALRDAERSKKMLLFIQEHYAERITTEQIARSAAVSVSECLRCFHSVLNLTPKAYLRQYRVQMAAQQLLETEKSIAEIGADCGFEDMSYFARSFRAEQGMTPSEYREKEKAGRPLLP